MNETIEVAVWMALRGDEVLAVRPHDQQVFFLPGGLIEPDEQAVDACAREVLEEVGHQIPPGALEELGTVHDQAVGRPHTRVALRCFTGGSLPDTLIPGEDEIAEIAWIGPSRASALSKPVLKALLAFGGTAWQRPPTYREQ